ncbi:NAD(P)-dependent oxidoreductase [Kushneria marisflavi]|uniref:6-phosphogluconate dehydrogenase n=1 Tax=Kushneria marisflavi TaxID=157779 RepID=A0A240UN92_9GAMM|nr:NAD(P)-dependent oxidoreductase [Kushneria marisflavi]ART62977.1 6-phosphogluconate dehydrogenase [Kushneria marisflavi]RKD84792.1 3-hydroxyisobutyrate dehydrogenase [Kushneria marisflavi]
MSHDTTVAVLGLGAMGHAFAANLLNNDLSVRVWNRTRSRGEDLAKRGALNADSAVEAVSDARFVITMLPDFETTHDVLLGNGGALEHVPDKGVVIQMGTIGVEQTETLIHEIETARPDVIFIDAPVSGTKAPAEQATISVLASGDQKAAEGIDTVFDAISKRVVWLGEAGRGSRMKLVVNAWLIHMMQGIAESARLARTLGFSTDDLWSVLEGGPLAAPYVKAKLGKIGIEEYSAQMALEWGLKDAQLALEAAGDTDLPGLARISEIWRDAVEAGLGQQDIAAIHDYLSRHQG